MQKQVERGKEVAKTRAAPVVADMVADAARATGEKLRQGKTIASEAISRRRLPPHVRRPGRGRGHRAGQARGNTPPGTSSAGGGATGGATVQEHTDAWSAATRPTGSSD